MIIFSGFLEKFCDLEISFATNVESSASVKLLA